MLDALPAQPRAETIIVTGRALPDPAAERAYSVETITGQELRNAPSSQVEEVLKQVPGLQLFRRSDARSGHPTSQGVTMRALGGNASSRALLILDGIPQADPFGGWVNWPAFDPAGLAQVRVVRGGGSVGHGPGALAGVIDLASRVEPLLEAQAMAGSRDSAEGRLFAGGAAIGSTFSLSARVARGDGFVPVTKETRGPADRPARYREANGRAVWLTPLSDDLDIQASVSAFTDRRERGIAFTGNRTDGLDGSLRLVSGGRWSWSATGYAQRRELRSSFASVDDDRGTATRVALQDEVPSQAYGGSFELRPPLGRSFELRMGADARLTRGVSRELYFYVDDEPTRRRRAGGDTVTSGAFSEVTGRLGRLTLSGGARVDYWRIADGSLEEWVLATGKSLRDERYPARQGWLPTARAGAAFDAAPRLTVRSAAYLGWRMPTLNELFRPFRAGADATAANALLDPERLAGLEAGADYRTKLLDMSVTLFANRLQDAIANVTLGQGPGVFPGVGFVGAAGEYRQRRNLGSVRVRGVEASAETRRGHWSLRLGGSFVEAKVQASGPAAALDGLRPAQTPEVSLTGGLVWERGGRSLSLILRHTGSQFEDDRNEHRLPSTTTLDAFGGWPLARRLQLVLRGENMLDERVVAGIGGDGSIERATPRTLWIGLQLTRSGIQQRR